MRWTVTLAMLVSLGCAPAPAPGIACDGPPPALEACDRGQAWADCGGTGGGPRFACRDSECLWFANDCVAEGFHASDCPADELCCHDAGASVRSPFEGAPTGQESLGVPDFTYGWGTEPWDAARETAVAVVVGPTSSASRPSIACTETSDLLSSSVCQHASDPLQGFVQRQGSVAVAFVTVPGSATFGGHTLTVEIMLDGAPRARVCSTPFTDGHPYGCNTLPVSRGCAVDGSVTIDSLDVDASTHVDVSATFADGSLVEMRI